MSEYKESERLVSDIDSTLLNIESDAVYLHALKSEFSSERFSLELGSLCEKFYNTIADNREDEYKIHFLEMQEILLI